MERFLTCIVCPRGCNMQIELGDDGGVLSVSGNSCKRGAAYAESECTHPVRTLTTTAAICGGGVVPVKTTMPIPKELVFEAMEQINRVRVSPDIKIGDVIIKNILDTGADIVATADA